MKHQHGIRKGDRYTWSFDGAEHRITVSSVTAKNATINVLQVGTGASWTKRQRIPFPAGFIKVHSAQPEICEACDAQPPAMGMAYCDDCIDVLAALGDSQAGF